jgi:hypothetical protein
MALPNGLRACFLNMPLMVEAATNVTLPHFPHPCSLHPTTLYPLCSCLVKYVPTLRVWSLYVITRSTNSPGRPSSSNTLVGRGAAHWLEKADAGGRLGTTGVAVACGMFASSRRVCSCLRRSTVVRSSLNAAPSPKLASVVASTCCRAALHDRNVSIYMPFCLSYTLVVAECPATVPVPRPTGGV